MEYLLTTTGSEDVFGEDGTPESSFEYQSSYTFDCLEECLCFIRLHAKHSSMYMEYKIEAM